MFKIHSNIILLSDAGSSSKTVCIYSRSHMERVPHSFCVLTMENPPPPPPEIYLTMTGV